MNSYVTKKASEELFRDDEFGVPQGNTYSVSNRSRNKEVILLENELEDFENELEVKVTGDVESDEIVDRLIEYIIENELLEDAVKTLNETEMDDIMEIAFVALNNPEIFFILSDRMDLSDEYLDRLRVLVSKIQNP